MTFIIPSIIRIQANGKTASEFSTSTPTNGQLTLSDHSRSPLSVSYEIIENSQRMVDGTMRKSIISKKKSFSCTWDMMPTVSTMMADGNADAAKMKAYYELYCYNPLTLTLRYKRNNAETPVDETCQVYWTDFSFDVVKRYKNFDYWNVSAEFTEI